MNVFSRLLLGLSLLLTLLVLYLWLWLPRQWIEQAVTGAADQALELKVSGNDWNPFTGAWYWRDVTLRNAQGFVFSADRIHMNINLLAVFSDTGLVRQGRISGLSVQVSPAESAEASGALPVYGLPRLLASFQSDWGAWRIDVADIELNDGLSRHRLSLDQAVVHNLETGQEDWALGLRIEGRWNRAPLKADARLEMSGERFTRWLDIESFEGTPLQAEGLLPPLPPIEARQISLKGEALRIRSGRGTNETLSRFSIQLRQASWQHDQWAYTAEQLRLGVREWQGLWQDDTLLQTRGYLSAEASGLSVWDAAGETRQLYAQSQNVSVTPLEWRATTGQSREFLIGEASLSGGELTALDSKLPIRGPLEFDTLDIQELSWAAYPPSARPTVRLQSATLNGFQGDVTSLLFPDELPDADLQVFRIHIAGQTRLSLGADASPAAWPLRLDPLVLEGLKTGGDPQPLSFQAKVGINSQSSASLEGYFWPHKSNPSFQLRASSELLSQENLAPLRDQGWLKTLPQPGTRLDLMFSREGSLGSGRLTWTAADSAARFEQNLSANLEPENFSWKAWFQKLDPDW